MPIVEVTYAPELAEALLARLLDALPHDVVIEVGSKWFESQAENRQGRCDQLCERIAEIIGTTSVGVYLSLPVAAWARLP
jgi:hypothetical protein